jgi:hypothetical protein
MRIRTCLGLVAVCALAGCGAGNGLTMGRVSGTISYKGEPVEFGDVIFVPDSGKGNNGVPSMGRIDKSGWYVMSTENAGDGVIAGYHKVGIRVFDPHSVNKGEAPEVDPATATGKELMEGKLRRRTAQSLLKRKNRAKQDAPTLNFGGTVYRFLIPEKLANPETSGIRVQVPQGSNRVDFAIAEDGTVKVSQ